VVEDHHALLKSVIAGDENAADQALREHFRIGDEMRRQKAIAPRKTAAPAAARKTRKTKATI